MKLLLDQGLPRGAVDLLNAHGHECLHVADVLRHDSDDSEIIAHARTHGQTIVSLDADFHTELALSGATSPSTIRLRVQGLKADELAGLINRICMLCEDDLVLGAMVSVDSTRVRVRRLPL